MKTIVLTQPSHGHQLGDEVEVESERAQELVDAGLARYADMAASRPKPPSVKQILAEVGNDAEKATAALEQEKAGENRPTLVAALSKLLEG